MQRPGVIVGQKGVKYGLQTRQKPQQQAQQPAGGRLAAFGGDTDSDEEGVGAQVARQAARKVADSKVQEMYAAALAEDPNAFEYDGVYDSMQEEKAVPKLRDKLARQPKYISSLLEQAELRKREQEITYERQLLKERQKEDHMYDGTEKFITSAYRRKLEEDKKWQESQRLKEMEEQRNDVTKLGHMNNFYTNLTRNVALGGSGASTAQPAAHNGKQQQQQQPPEQSPSRSPEGGRRAPSAKQQEPAAEQAAAAAANAPQELGQRPEQQQRSGTPERPQEHRSLEGEQQQQQQQQPPPRESSREPAAAVKQQQQQQQAASGMQADPAAAAAAGVQQTVGGKRKNDDAAVAAARERYLARKRQQQGGGGGA